MQIMCVKQTNKANWPSLLTFLISQSKVIRILGKQIHKLLVYTHWVLTSRVHSYPFLNVLIFKIAGVNLFQNNFVIKYHRFIAILE